MRFTMVLLLLYSLGICTELENLKANFICKKQENDSIKTISGSIHYQAPHTAYITTQRPFEQEIYILDNEMVLYSVESNTAYAYSSETNITIPYLSDFFPALLEDFGLSQSGFSIKDVQSVQDTLITSWQSKNDKAKKEIFTYFVENFLIQVSSCNHDGSVNKKIVFSEHYTESLYPFPLKMEIFDANQTRIKMTELDSIQINSSLIPSIEFTLPENAIIKEYNW